MTITAKDHIARLTARVTPRRVLYWSVVRAHAIATTGKFSTTPCPADAATMMQHLSDGLDGRAMPGHPVAPGTERIAGLIVRAFPRRLLFAARERLLLGSLGYSERWGRVPKIVKTCQECDGSGVTAHPIPDDTARPVPDDETSAAAPGPTCG